MQRNGEDGYLVQSLMKRAHLNSDDDESDSSPAEAKKASVTGTDSAADSESESDEFVLPSRDPSRRVAAGAGAGFWTSLPKMFINWTA
jgi:hypothetical protein